MAATLVGHQRFDIRRPRRIELPHVRTDFAGNRSRRFSGHRTLVEQVDLRLHLLGGGPWRQRAGGAGKAEEVLAKGGKDQPFRRDAGAV